MVVLSRCDPRFSKFDLLIFLPKFVLLRARKGGWANAGIGKVFFHGDFLRGKGNGTKQVSCAK